MKGGIIMKKIILVFLAIGMILSVSGCVYSHNYDKNGNEMNEEQVKEHIDDVKDNIKNQIDSAITEEKTN